MEWPRSPSSFTTSPASAPTELIHLLIRTPLRLLIAGHQAVILFFLLSGFVLTLPYKKKTGLGYGPFLVKRVCRIYLPYLGALALAILCDLSFPGHVPYRQLTGSMHLVATRQPHLVISAHPLPRQLRLVSVQHCILVPRLRDANLSRSSPSSHSLSCVFVPSGSSSLRSALSAAFFPIVDPLFRRLAPLHSRWRDQYHAYPSLRGLLHHRFGVSEASPCDQSLVRPAHTRSCRDLALVSLSLYGFGSASSLFQRTVIPADLFDWLVAAVPSCSSSSR